MLPNEPLNIVFVVVPRCGTQGNETRTNACSWLRMPGKALTAFSCTCKLEPPSHMSILEKTFSFPRCAWQQAAWHYKFPFFPIFHCPLQMMLGALSKTFLSQRLGVPPDDIITVSIMPCTAKKHEAARPEMRSAGVFWLLKVKHQSLIIELLSGCGNMRATVRSGCPIDDSSWTNLQLRGCGLEIRSVGPVRLCSLIIDD